MSVANVLIISLSTLIFYGMLELLTFLFLIKNIDSIRKRKKGLLYNYAKMKLGEKFFTL
jgi:hypothetical protein